MEPQKLKTTIFLNEIRIDLHEILKSFQENQEKRQTCEKFEILERFVLNPRCTPASFQSKCRKKWTVEAVSYRTSHFGPSRMK